MPFDVQTHGWRWFWHCERPQFCYHGGDKNRTIERRLIHSGFCRYASIEEGGGGRKEPRIQVASPRSAPSSKMFQNTWGIIRSLKFDLSVLVFLVARGPTKRGARSGSKRDSPSVTKTTSVSPHQRSSTETGVRGTYYLPKTSTLQQHTSALTHQSFQIKSPNENVSAQCRPPQTPL